MVDIEVDIINCKEQARAYALGHVQSRQYIVKLRRRTRIWNSIHTSFCFQVGVKSLFLFLVDYLGIKFCLHVCSKPSLP